PAGVRIMAQGEYVAASLADYLQRHPEMEARCTKGASCHYLTTESVPKFQESAALFMHEDVTVEQITL
ncbi:MAG: glutamate racemase, partial [Bacteroidaceae bacterium]|nr:glutamate racemase [Bacteroidaceae bacterium]